MSSCDDISLYDESVIINEVLNNEDQDPLVTQDITLTYVTSINNGPANTSLRFKADLSPNIDLNSIIDLGLVYNNTGEPNITESKVSASSVESANTIDVDQLLEGQTYYFRAYMITNQGIFYSSDQVDAIVPQDDENQNSIITQDITLTYITYINNGSANNSLRFEVDLSPNIDFNSITDLGLVYNNTGEPNMTDSKVSASSVEAANIIDVDQLLEGQTYYFRAYMITDQGTFYSSDEVDAIAPQTNCSIYTEDNHINDWYYLIEPDQNVYNASEIYEITVLSPANFNFSNQYEIYLYVNEDEVQYICSGLDFESFYDNEGVLNYTYNYSIPEDLTPSTCYTMRIIPAEWSNEDDTAVSNPFTILQ
jgi:hypothetical protein